MIYPKHNKRNSREYNAWKGIKAHCYNPNNSGYKYYGERGITVCDEWKNSFIKFYEDMKDCPIGFSLDRIDVNGNYCKENCRWATKEEQERNKRNNFLVTYKGETKSLSEFCDNLNLDYRLIYERINRQKWCIEDAFTINKLKTGGNSGNTNP